MCGCAGTTSKASIQEEAPIIELKRRYRLIGILALDKEVPNPNYNPDCIISVMFDSPTIKTTEFFDVIIGTYRGISQVNKLLDEFIGQLDATSTKVKAALDNGADAEQNAHEWGKTQSTFTDFVGFVVEVENWTDEETPIYVPDSRIRVKAETFKEATKKFWSNELVSYQDVYNYLKQEAAIEAMAKASA